MNTVEEVSAEHQALRASMEKRGLLFTKSLKANKRLKIVHYVLTGLIAFVGVMAISQEQYFHAYWMGLFIVFIWARLQDIDMNTKLMELLDKSVILAEEQNISLMKLYAKETSHAPRQ